MSKIAKLKLSYPHETLNVHLRVEPLNGTTTCYRVEQLGNSVEYNPGQYLRKQEVEQLCGSKHWDVTIVPAVKK